MIARSSNRPVAASDRVSDVLSRDESLVEVFVRAAPQLAKLRNPAMRRVMARLVTIEHVARIAGVSCDALLDDLNASLGIAPGASPPAAASQSGERTADRTRRAAARPTGATEVTLDVRDDLRAGREPFSAIMAAIANLGAREVLHLRAIFEPLPLYAVLEKRGFSHESQAHADDDWSVWFWRATQQNNAPAATTNSAAADGSLADIVSDFGPDTNVVWLDVRWLEPPEPLVRTLTALETLPDDHTLVQVNLRVPQFLLPMLAERGYAYDIDESHAEYVLVRIRKATPHDTTGLDQPHHNPEEIVDVSTTSIELDVRPIPPREKHPSIFRAFDNLTPGQSLILVNDHDPKPLRYQLQAERPETFDWTYEAEGPQVWRVRISRR